MIQELDRLCMKKNEEDASCINIGKQGENFILITSTKLTCLSVGVKKRKKENYIVWCFKHLIIIHIMKLVITV